MWRFDSFHRHMLELKLVGAGIATLALGGVGVGMGTLFGSLLNAASRNPKQRDQLFSYAILGAALTEAIALFALMIAFLLLFLEFLESTYSLFFSFDSTFAHGINAFLASMPP
jgi:F-type H+-transporting ATPase subunit c